MKKSLIVVLQVFVVLLGIGILALILWFPNIEGVNANATSFSQVYLDDPFLAFAYFASISIFVGLYQVFKILGLVAKDKLNSVASIKSFRVIKYCAVAMISFAIVALAIIMQNTSDDRAGGVAMGLFLILTSSAIGFTASKVEKVLKRSIKSA